MKLISMTDFVFEQWYPDNLEGDEHAEVYQTIHNYARFLKQPLTLGMFITCDEEGNIMEELKYCCTGSDCGCMGMPKERVLFEFDGCLSLIRNKSNFYIMEDKNGVCLTILKNKTKTTIESLLNFSVEITLTETAKKQIGL